MRRENSFCVFWSRFAHASTAALIVLVLAGAARADTIEKFFVKGTAENVSGMDLGSCGEDQFCSFSGTMMVDVSATVACVTVEPRGCVTAYDITFPGVAPFSCCSSQGPFGSGWLADSVDNINGVVLRFDFTTTIPESLVGFEGGSITGFDVVGPGFATFYSNFSGSITPVPEPSSLALLGSGLIGLAGLARRKLNI